MTTETLGKYSAINPLIAYFVFLANSEKLVLKYGESVLEFEGDHEFMAAAEGGYAKLKTVENDALECYPLIVSTKLATKKVNGCTSDKSGSGLIG